MADENISQIIADAIVTHHVNLLRVAADLRQPVFDALLELEKSVVAEIATLPDDAGAVKVARLNALLAQTKAEIDDTYATIAANQGKQLKDIAGIEETKTAQVVDSAIGVRLMTVGMTRDQLEGLASDTMVNGGFPSQWWDQQSEDLKRQFEAQMRDGLFRGEGIDALTRRVRGLLDVKNSQAEAIVRTSVMAVSNQTKLDSFAKNLDVIKGIQWVSTLDSRTTPTCIALNGKEWTLPDYTPVGHNMVFPGPIAHWNCFTDDVPMCSPSAVRRHYSRKYSGELWIIETDNGRRVTLTPNHPLLTPSGWRPASQLNIGDNLICQKGRCARPVATGIPNDKQVKATFAEHAKSFRVLSGMLAIKVPTAAPDFHGDAANQEICEVLIDGELLDEKDFPIFKLVRNCRLNAGNFDSAESLAGTCRLYQRLQARLSAALCRVRSCYGRCFAALPTRAQIFRTRTGDAGSSAPTVQCSEGDLVFPGDFARRHLVGGVELDRIRMILRRKAVSVRVHNLETEAGWYLADGIIAHNCRSTQIAIVKSWEELGGKPEITSDNIEDYRGDVDTTQLEKYAGNELDAFQATPDTTVVPIDTLISLKNELLDPKFIAGTKADPRVNAIKGMLNALENDGKKRLPLDVYANGDGTYTVVDGNATAQAAMLADWKELPINIVKKPGTLEPDTIEAIFRKQLAAKGFTQKEIDDIVAEKRLTIDGEPAQPQTFDQFLKSKTKEFQDQLLGVQKAQLWREGKITFNDLVDQSGRPLTVDELRAMVSKNEALAAVKHVEGENGLGMMERRLLEESLVYGAQNKGVMAHFIDMATGERITIRGLLGPTPQELEHINKMQDVMYLRNSTGIGESFTPQEIGMFSKIKGFGGARIVTPDGRVISLTMRPSADAFATADASKLNSAVTSLIGQGKSDNAALKLATQDSPLRYDQTPTGAVTPTAQQFAQPDKEIASQIQVKEAADQLAQQARIKESAVTQLMQMVANETQAELSGLEFRLKAPDSLERKIALDMKDKGIPAGDAAAQISDALRYTMVVPDDRYTFGALQALNALERDGLMRVVNVKNFWDGVSYEGINVKLETADGFKVELQFHTPSTLMTKKTRSHPIYELLRATTDPKAIKAYKQQLEDLWKDIQMPRGADKITNDNWRDLFAKQTAAQQKAIDKLSTQLGREAAAIRKSITDSVARIEESRTAYNAAWEDVRKLMAAQDKIIQANQGGRLGTPEGKDALAEFERNKKTLSNLRIKTQQMYAQLQNEEKIAIAKAQQRLRITQGDTVTLDVAREPKVAKIAEEGAQILANLIPDGRLLNTSAEFYAIPEGADAVSQRGYQVPGTGHIYLSGSQSTARTALHELGHWMETFNPTIHRDAIDFLNKRTAGETAAKLSKLIPGSSYADYEIAKPDKFMSPYMGKIYKDAAGDLYATEIVSMGLECLWFNPIEFARDDPEYFDFIYKLIKMVAPIP